MKFGGITAEVVLLEKKKKKILIFVSLWTFVVFQWSKENGEPWKPNGMVFQ